MAAPGTLSEIDNTHTPAPAPCHYLVVPWLYPGGSADLAYLVHEQSEIAGIIQDLAYLIEVIRLKAPGLVENAYLALLERGEQLLRSGGKG